MTYPADFENLPFERRNSCFANQVARKSNGAASQGISVEDFHAYMPMHSYIFTPSREMWPAASINARIPPIEDPSTDKPIPASAWLDKNKPVEQMTWAPGKPMLIKNRLISDGGWIDRDGVSCFNLYRPPIAKHGDPKLADVWIDHVNRVYPNDADHIVKWLAQRVQRPEEKIIVKLKGYRENPCISKSLTSPTTLTSKSETASIPPFTPRVGSP